MINVNECQNVPVLSFSLFFEETRGQKNLSHNKKKVLQTSLDERKVNFPPQEYIFYEMFFFFFFEKEKSELIFWRSFPYPVPIIICVYNWCTRYNSVTPRTPTMCIKDFRVVCAEYSFLPTHSFLFNKPLI